MSVEITTVSSADLVPRSFMPRWRFGEHPYENYNAKVASAMALKKQARLHVLSINGRDCGFVAVNIHQLEKNNPYYIQLVYLFVSKPHRNRMNPDLAEMSVSTYLMSHVISESLEIAKFLPVKELILDPASPRLETYYEEEFGFKHVPGLPKYSPKFMSLHLDWRGEKPPAEA